MRKSHSAWKGLWATKCQACLGPLQRLEPFLSFNWRLIRVSNLRTVTIYRCLCCKATGAPKMWRKKCRIDESGTLIGFRVEAVKICLTAVHFPSWSLFPITSWVVLLYGWPVLFSLPEFQRWELSWYTATVLPNVDVIKYYFCTPIKFMTEENKT